MGCRAGFGNILRVALSGLRSGKQQEGPLLIFVLAAISILAPLVIHLFYPATPGVKQTFDVSDSVIGLTASIPLFVLAFFTLVYGSLSDRYGRRPVLLVGLLLFVLGSALSAAAPTIWALVAGRLLQAIGAACGMTLARAIARDVYGPDKLVRILSYLLMAYALGPMAATPVGGFLAEHLGWRSVLIFAGGIGLFVAALVYFIIAETREPSAAGSPRLSFLSDCGNLLGNVNFTAYVLQSGFCSGAFFTLLGASAFLMVDYLDRTASEFGLYFLFFPAGYWIGNFISSRLSGRVDIDIMVIAGSTVALFTAIGLAALMVSGFITPLSIFIPGFLITFAQGMALPNAQAGALQVSRDRAGTASGIGTFMQFFWAAAFTQLYGLLADGTPIPMAITFSIAASLSFAASTVPFLRRRR